MQKTKDACTAFGCIPWMAVYVEAKDHADLFLTSLDNYWEKYCNKEAKGYLTWKMSREWRRLYDADANVQHIYLTFEERDGFNKKRK